MGLTLELTPSKTHVVIIVDIVDALNMYISVDCSQHLSAITQCLVKSGKRLDPLKVPVSYLLRLSDTRLILDSLCVL